MNGKQFIAAGLLILVAIWYLGKRGYGSSAASAPNQPSNPSSPARGCGCDAPNSGVDNSTAPANPVSSSSSSLSQPWAAGAGANSDLAGSLAPGSNADAPGSGGNWQGLRTQTRGALTPPQTPDSPYSPTSNYVAIPYSNPAWVSA